MSLQGSIETFAIADVLRLLAATSKTGRLHVQGPSRAGTVWVDSARVLAADSPSTPHVAGPVDVLFQLLRFERGSFRFELDKAPTEPGEPLDIELALGEAESMLREWRQLEQQIPSGESWVQLQPALSASAVTLDADEWSTLVAVSGGRSVAEVGDRLSFGELRTAQALARLLDLGLVEVGVRPTAAPLGLPPAPPPAIEAVEAASAQAQSDPSPLNVPAPAEAVVAPVGLSALAPPSPVSTAAPAEPDGAVASNGFTPLAPAPPVPPTPLTPPSPTWSPSPSSLSSWAAPEYPPLAPPPEWPSPAAAWSEGPGQAGSSSEASTFATPPETDLDGTASPPFSYPVVDNAADPYSYPPPSDSPSGWALAAATPSLTSADDAPDEGPAPAGPVSGYPSDRGSPGDFGFPGGRGYPSDNGSDGGYPSENGATSDTGYPALPPPMPPAYISPTASVVPNPPSWALPTEANLVGGAADPAGAGTVANGNSPNGPTGPAATSSAEGAWIGSLADAIERADDGFTPADDATIQARSQSPGQTTSTPGSATGGSSTLGAWPPAGSLPPPPPAPPAPRGGWASPTSLFGNGSPERLAPPPPPPPPMGGPLLGGDPGQPGAVTVSARNEDAAPGASTDADNPDDIDRQLFNLSPRAREAVKQSSGLFDGRDRR